MDHKYAKSDKSKAARRLRKIRLSYRSNITSIMSLDSGTTHSGTALDSVSDVWFESQNRLKQVPNALYENWVVRKTRLLSRQRKVVRDVFKSIENGTFP